LRAIPGAAPSGPSEPTGCAFADRCPLALDACRAAPPTPTRLPDDHSVRCIRVDAQGRLT